MNACSDASRSVNGLTTKLVAKQKIKPKKIEIGKAGNAFRVIANSKSVKHKPCKENNQLFVSEQCDS
jgi:hypothetical protein